MMKNYFLRSAAAIALLCGAVAVSCSSGDDNEGGKDPGTGTGPDNMVTALTAKCDYKGDYAGKGTNYFDLTMASCPTDATGKATGAGYIFNLNLNSLQADMAKPIPANGIYNFDATSQFAANTIAYSVSKVTEYNAALVSTPYSLTGASLTVAKDGDSFKLEGTVKLSNGTELTLKASNFVWEDMSEGTDPNPDPDEPKMLEENIEFSAKAAAAGYLGGLLTINATNETPSIYQIILAKEQTGPTVQAMIMMPNVKYFRYASVPEGTFEISENIGTNMALPGMTMDDNIVFYGLWYMDEATMTLGQGVGGTVNITKAGANYTVTIDSETPDGYTIKSSYTGPLTLQDVSGTASNLKNDVVIDFAGVQNATAAYYGDFYEMGTGNWSIDVGTSTTKEGFMIDCFVADPAQTTMPTGSFIPNWSGQSNTCIPGGIIEQNGSTYVRGSFYYTKNDEGLINTMGPVVDSEIADMSTIKITQSGTNYKFDFDIVDDNGYKISGTWTGPVTIKKGQTSAPAKSAKASVGLNDMKVFKSFNTNYFTTQSSAIMLKKSHTRLQNALPVKSFYFQGK